jgi:hypothetical protein
MNADEGENNLCGRNWSALDTIMIPLLLSKVKHCAHNHTDCWRTSELLKFL